MPHYESEFAPTLAILITYYNEGPLLRECLESILQQTDPPDEVLIYDDASRIPADQFVPAGMRARVIRGVTNAGPGQGRNVLLAESRCDFVHFHDADDLFTKDWSRRVRTELSGEVDLVVTELQAIREGNVMSNAVLSIEQGLSELGDLVRFCLQGVLLPASTTFRKDVAISLGGYRVRNQLAQSEDYDFHARLAAAIGSRYIVITDPLIVQRQRADSLSSDRRSVWIAAVHALRYLEKDLPQRYHSDLSEAAARFATQLYELGERSEGNAAAVLARRLGSPKFADRHIVFRVMARSFGQEIAEAVGRIYRQRLTQRRSAQV